MKDFVDNNLLNILDNILRIPTDIQRQESCGNIRVDVKEYDDKYSLVADMPGLTKDNVKIKFEKGSLTISVVSEVETKKEEGKIIHSERFSSLRSRSFYFGDNVNDQDIKASYKDGVLSLDIPKHKPTVNVREINIE